VTRISLFLILILAFPCFALLAQVGHGGLPYALENDLIVGVPVHVLPVVNPHKENEIDKKHYAFKGKPYRFGVEHSVSLNLDNSGYWTVLENGDRLWQLRIDRCLYWSTTNQKNK